MFILGLIIGLTIGSLAIFLIMSKISKAKKDKYSRRGLYTGAYNTSSAFSTTSTDFTLSVEIAEMERTKTKSKIKIIGKIKATKDLTDTNIEKLKKMIEGWVETDTSEIEWFEKHPSDVRAEKIDNVLN